MSFKLKKSRREQCSLNLNRYLTPLPYIVDICQVSLGAIYKFCGKINHFF